MRQNRYQINCPIMDEILKQNDFKIFSGKLDTKDISLIKEYDDILLKEFYKLQFINNRPKSIHARLTNPKFYNNFDTTQEKILILEKLRINQLHKKNMFYLTLKWYQLLYKKIDNLKVMEYEYSITDLKYPNQNMSFRKILLQNIKEIQ